MTCSAARTGFIAVIFSLWSASAFAAQALPPTNTPPVTILPASVTNPDPTGSVTTFQPNGAISTQGNAFFTALGSNGRSCPTCHKVADGWGLSAADAQALFTQTNGADPLFRVIDGAVCPTDAVNTTAAQQQAYRLLLSQGLIRIGLSVPANAQFTIAVQKDQDRCTGTAATGLISPSGGTVNTYRRPLPTTNLAFLSSVMWDGREPDLAHQALDATLTHEQSGSGATAAQQKQIAAFESGLFSAQTNDATAGNLTLAGGGPVALSATQFAAGINDSVGQNPTGAAFSPTIFSLYSVWNGLTGADPQTQARASIARGQQVFNTKPITIQGVAGLNDLPGRTQIRGTCGTCHDTPAVGSRSLPLFLDIGVAAPQPAALNASQLPVFALTCTAATANGAPQPILTTDPGRALTTGACADISKFKVPQLRMLAARAPYFHNGTAAGLNDVLSFYEGRFNFRFTQQERADLINFLNAL